MNCDEIKDYYLMSLRTVLSPDETERLHNHLASCSICRKTYSLDRTIVSMIQNSPPVSPQAEFVSFVCKQVSLQREYVKLSFRHLLFLSMGLVAIFATVGIFWRDFLIKVFYFILNHSLTNFAQITENVQDSLNILLTASSYHKAISQLPYHLSWMIWIIFTASLFFLISLLFSFTIYPIKKTTKTL